MLGTKIVVKKIGMLIPTLKSLKKFISSNRFKIKPKQKKIQLVVKTTLRKTLARYLFIMKDLNIVIGLNSRI